MTNPKPMKVSDEERENATQQLSRAFVAGRIDYSDFEGRIERVLRARNHIELGEVVVDLPVRAPAPPPAPTPRDYLPANALSRERGTAQPSRLETDRAAEVSRRSVVVLAMGLPATLVLAAVAFGVRELVVKVVPSASTVALAELAVIVVVAVLFAVYSAAASLTAIPRRVNGRPKRPPMITS
jgi:hypothetical protein